MGTHLTGDFVGKLRRRELPEEEIAPALRHIAECSACAKLASGEVSADIGRAQDLLADEAAEPPHHLEEEELFGWVDGTLGAESRALVQTHLDECALCLEDAHDLERLRDDPPARRGWIWLAAAAAAAALLTMLLIGRDTASSNRPVVRESPVVSAPLPVESRPSTESYAKPEWNDLVNRVLASGRLPFPSDLASLRGESQTLRGESESAAGRLQPSGVYIDATSPEMSWRRIRGATYVVTILHGDEPVAHSGILSAPRWIPPRPLERGRTYVWQVEATRDGTTEVLPEASAPPAMFRIVSASDHREIAAALERHPADHLLLAALFARAGLEAEAKKHLGELAGSADPRIRRLTR